MDWIKKLISNKEEIQKEAELTNQAIEWEKKVKKNDWIESVMSSDEDAITKEAEAKDQAELNVRLQHKQAAYEVGDTMKDTIEKDYDLCVRGLSDYHLAEMLAEHILIPENKVTTHFNEEKEKQLKAVKSDRKAAESKMLKMIGEHSMVDWKAAFEKFSKEAEHVEPSKEDLYPPFEPGKQNWEKKVDMDKAPSDKERVEGMAGVGREEKERTDVTSQGEHDHMEKEASKKEAVDNGPADEDVQQKAWEMFKQHWNALSSTQQDEVYKALGVEVEPETFVDWEGSDEDFEDLADIMDSRLGGAISEQFVAIVKGDTLENQNPNALRYIAEFLEKRRNDGAQELAAALRTYLKTQEKSFDPMEAFLKPKRAKKASVYPNDLKYPEKAAKVVFQKTIKIGSTKIIIIGSVDNYGSDNHWVGSVTATAYSATKSNIDSSGSYLFYDNFPSKEDAVAAVKAFEKVAVDEVAEQAVQPPATPEALNPMMESSFRSKIEKKACRIGDKVYYRGHPATIKEIFINKYSGEPHVDIEVEGETLSLSGKEIDQLDDKPLAEDMVHEEVKPEPVVEDVKPELPVAPEMEIEAPVEEIEIEQKASKVDTMKKIAEIESPWKVIKDESGQEVIAKVAPEKSTKESEEKKDLSK